MKLRLFFVLLVVLSIVGLTSAQDTVELRITWYNDGNEGEALQKQLDKFMEANPNITVVVDTVAYADLHTTLQAQVEAGTPPDLARITDVARFRGAYLDLTDLVADAAYWTDNFPVAVLDSLRSDAEDTGIYGYPTQFTVTAPFINRTLFEQAGVAVPSDEADEVTWEQWVTAAKEVAAATETPYAVAIDPRGHRFWGFSLVQGATYINDDGTFTVDTEGFRTSAEALWNWQSDGIMPPESWATKDLAIAKDLFTAGQVVFYYSGSWQVASFESVIGDTFDWEAIPNPTGPGGSTGIPGGAVAVAFAGTEHPAEAARLMDFLASAESLGEFSADALFIPGHLGLAAGGVDYATNKDQLSVLLAEIPKISDQAYKLQYSAFTFVLNPAITDNLSEYLVGQKTLDEALTTIQETIDQAVADAAAQ